MNKPIISEKEVVLKYNVKIIWNIVLNKKYFTKFTLNEKWENLLK
jgi:hypothetical protein